VAATAVEVAAGVEAAAAEEDQAPQVPEAWEALLEALLLLDTLKRQ